MHRALLAVLSLVLLVPAPLAAAQPAPQPAPTTGVPSVAVMAGATPVGAPSAAPIAPTGGQAAFADGAVNVQALADPARPALTLVYQALDARTLPPAQSGLSLGFTAFQLSAVSDNPPALVPSFNVPINLILRPTDSDMALAVGQLSRLHVASWNGNSWVALPCAPDVGSGNLLVCSTLQPGLFVPLIVLPINPALDQLDWDVDGGHFYLQGNGFGGGGGLGYAVLDDGDAPMWSEFQRQGGVRRLGYPVTNRFVYNGAITQAFQNGALQWQPDFGQSVLLNVLDDLHAHGSDAWLDTTRQVPPPPPDGKPGDPSMLSPFPGMLAAYEADPDLYGLPVALKDYGQLTGARFQRSTLYIWNQDQPSAAAGTVVVGNSGDLAKAAGLWPVSAATPAGPPPS